MKKNLLQSFGFLKAKGKSLAVLLMFLFMLFGVCSLQAQRGHYVQGKVQIDKGGFLYVSTGDTVHFAGNVTTTRDTAMKKRGMMSFAGNAGWKSDGSFVNGYVRSHKTGGFVFPVGQGSYRPAAINAALDDFPMDVTYYNTAFFDTLVLSGELVRITNESWIIQGEKPAVITLSWTSDISTLASDFEQLCVAGWDMAVNKWVAIASAVDLANSPIFGAVAPDFERSGSVSTLAALVPNNYAAYTLGIRCYLGIPSITGNNSECPRTTSIYSIDEVSGAGTYFWSVSGTGWSIASGQGTPNIVANVGTGNGTIRVTASNECSSEYDEITVDVTVVAPPKLKKQK